MGTKGYVDGVRDGVLFGWAHDPERPSERIEVEVELDGQRLGRCVAEQAREDLLRERIGDGRHGFRFRLPAPLEAEAVHRVAVTAVHDGSAIRLADDYFGELRLVEDRDGSGLLDGEPPRQESPSAERPAAGAVEGDGGWLFAEPSPDHLPLVRGEVPWPVSRREQEIERLRKRTRAIEDLGSAYLLAIVPDKAAVYAEHLSGRAPYRSEYRPAAQLAAALRDEQQLEIVDLEPVLRAARRHGRVFTRRGAGLTWKGAFHAYRAVAKELAKRVAIEPLPVSWLSLGDLVPIPDPLAPAPAENGPGAELEPDVVRERLHAKPSHNAAARAEHLGPGGSSLHCESAQLRGAALVVHDGSAGRLVPFLAEHFADTAVAPIPEPPLALIEQLRPAVVVQIVADGRR